MPLVPLDPGVYPRYIRTMRTTIQQWGNSLGVRIPIGLARDAGVQRGTAVEIRVERNRLVLRPLARKSYLLADLLRGVRPVNRHGEVDAGHPVGREAW